MRAHRQRRCLQYGAPAGAGQGCYVASVRIGVYVDGFNLYYGVLEGNSAWKWLNLQSLFEASARTKM